MSHSKTALAMVSVSLVIMVFGSKIAIDPAWETSVVKPTIKVPKYAPVDEGFEPQGDIERSLSEGKTPREESIIVKREPTIVDGTKKAVTIRDKFILGAVSQYGVTNSYNGAYKKIAYPNGDVDITTGVCSDVIIRAFRAVGIDLQKEIHRDMQRHFRQYPRKWGLKSPDTNIDHRRVPNMVKYFERKGYKVSISQKNDFENYLPGDLVVWRIRDSLTHIGIVSDQKVAGTSRYYIIHNPFQGVEISDWLIEFKIINHFRVFGKNEK